MLRKSGLDEARKRMTAAKKKHAAALADAQTDVPKSVTTVGNRRFTTNRER